MSNVILNYSAFQFVFRYFCLRILRIQPLPQTKRLEKKNLLSGGFGFVQPSVLEVIGLWSISGHLGVKGGKNATNLRLPLPHGKDGTGFVTFENKLRKVEKKLPYLMAGLVMNTPNQFQWLYTHIIWMYMRNHIILLSIYTLYNM